MRVTWRGVVALCVVVVPVTVAYLYVYVWFVLAALAAKYTLGDDAAHGASALLRRVSGFVEHMFFVLVAAVLELVLGTDVTYSVVVPRRQRRARGEGDDVRLSRLLAPPSSPGKAKLILVNHHCRLDWVYLMCYYARLPHTAPLLRIVLKDSLRRLPIGGYAMDTFRYLFLSRTWANDEAYLRAMLRDDEHDASAASRSMTARQVILIFPEGTDLSPANVARSRAYARAHGLPEFAHVLNPRTTGVVALTQMLGSDAVESVVDCTIAYTTRVHGVRPSEASLLDGQHARSVHLLLREWPARHANTSSSSPSTSVPCDDADALAAWLHARFAEKEQLLARVYGDADADSDEQSSDRSRADVAGFGARDVRAVLHDDADALDVVTYSTAAATAATLLTRATRFVRDVGARHALSCVLFYTALPVLLLYVAMHYAHMRVTTLLLVNALTWALVWWLARRPHGLQALLYLRRVDAHAALLPRIAAAVSSWRAARRRRHDKAD